MSRALLLPCLAVLACTGEPDTPQEAPAAGPAAASGPEPAADDLRRVLALAEQCLPAGASTDSAALERVGGQRWLVGVRVSPDAEVTRVEVDPIASTCDGEAAQPAPRPALASLDVVVAQCWRQAQAEGGTGVGGSALRLQPTVSVHQQRITVSFPEAEQTTRPTGLDLSYKPATASCTRALMD